MAITLNNLNYDGFLDSDHRFHNLQVTNQLQVDAGITGNITGFASGDTPTVISGDGAITITPGTVILTKGSAAAITIAAPSTPAQDNIVIEVYSESAFAHVITCSTDGFNGKGSSGTVTFGNLAGNFVRLRARNGHWFAVIKTGTTVA